MHSKIQPFKSKNSLYLFCLMKIKTHFRFPLKHTESRKISEIKKTNNERANILMLLRCHKGFNAAGYRYLKENLWNYNKYLLSMMWPLSLLLLTVLTVFTHVFIYPVYTTPVANGLNVGKCTFPTKDSYYTGVSDYVCDVLYLYNNNYNIDP